MADESMDNLVHCEICGIETLDYIGKPTAAGFRYYCKKCYAAIERGEIEK